VTLRLTTDRNAKIAGNIVMKSRTSLPEFGSARADEFVS